MQRQRMVGIRARAYDSLMSPVPHRSRGPRPFSASVLLSPNCAGGEGLGVLRGLSKLKVFSAEQQAATAAEFVFRAKQRRNR